MYSSTSVHLAIKVCTWRSGVSVSRDYGAVLIVALGDYGMSSVHLPTGCVPLQVTDGQVFLFSRDLWGRCGLWPGSPGPAGLLPWLPVCVLRQVVCPPAQPHSPPAQVWRQLLSLLSSLRQALSPPGPLSAASSEQAPNPRPEERDV